MVETGINEVDNLKVVCATHHQLVILLVKVDFYLRKLANIYPALLVFIWPWHRAKQRIKNNIIKNNVLRIT